MNCNLSLAMIWQMMYTHKLPKLCSGTLKMPSRKLCSRQPTKAPRQRTMRAEFSLIRALISNWHTERIMGSYEKLFFGGGGGGRLMPVRNLSKSKYCGLFSKYWYKLNKWKVTIKKRLHYKTQSGREISIAMFL